MGKELKKGNTPDFVKEIDEVLKREVESHKVTRNKLFQAKQFMKNIIESSLDMIIAGDQKGNISEMNKAALIRFGYQPDDILGSTVKKLYANDHEYERVKKALYETGNFSGEVLNIDREGNYFSSYLSSAFITDENNNNVGSMGVSRDISQIKETRKKLQEQSARIHSIFESSSHLMWSVNPNLEFTSFNQNFKSWVRAVHQVEPKLGANFSKEDSAIIEDFNLNWKENYKRAFNGEKVRFEYCFEQIEDKDIWQEIFLSPIFGDKGEVIEVSGIGHHITYKKQAQRKIKEQNAKINAIFNSTDHLIWTLDSELRVTSFNKNFAKKHFEIYNKEVEIGEDYPKYAAKQVTSLSKNDISKRFKKAFSKEEERFELQLKDTKGKEIWLEVFVNPIISEDSRILELTCIAHEVTDQKNTENHMRESLKEKEILLQEVHHRVKNNLQVISSILNLQSSYVKDKNTLDILRESQNRIKSMSFIHESLYQTKDFNMVDFSDYILGLTKNLMYSYNLVSSQVKLETKMDRVHLNLDQAIPCGLIVNELVSNSMKYAFPEDEMGIITIHINENNNRIKLLVQDDGIGLPEGFDIEDSDSLGLQLVSTLIAQLDGSIELSSNQGTKYLITFDKQNT